MDDLARASSRANEPALRDTPFSGRRCSTCGAIVPWQVARFCLNMRPRFQGRVYCKACQAAIPPASATG